MQEFQENKSCKSFSLLTSTVKPAPSKDRPNAFELVCIDQSYFMETETKEEMGKWMEKIQEGIALMLNSVTSAKEKAISSSGTGKGTTPEQEWRLIQQVSPKNTFCADCNAPGFEKISFFFSNVIVKIQKNLIGLQSIWESLYVFNVLVFIEVLEFIFLKCDL